MLTHDHVCLKLLMRFIDQEKGNFNELSWDEIDSNDNKVKMVMIDAGSNNGDFAKLFLDNLSSQYDITVYGFEPNPTVEVRHNLTENTDYVRLIKALGHEAGEMTIKVPIKHGETKSDTHCSSLYHLPIFDTWKDCSVKEFKTEVVTLDTFVEENTIEIIDYLKVDVEGWEHNVFKGAEKLLKNGKVLAGHFEYALSMLNDTNQGIGDIPDFLAKYGYACFWGQPGVDQVLTATNFEQVLKSSPDQWENILFIRSDLLQQTI